MKKTFIAAIISLIVNPLAMFAQTDTKSTVKDLSMDYDAFVRKTMERIPEIPSVAIVVIKDDKPVFLRAYGLADKEAGVKAGVDTLYYHGSTTKSFTATVAALLDREGKIKLDDPMTKYAGGLTFKAPIPDKVTVRNLLTHTSGLRNGPLVFRLAFSGEINERDILRVFSEATTFDDARHGKYAYDNLGYNIYGLLVQRTLNKRWQDLLEERIFRPLGMRHTTTSLSRARAATMPVAESYMFSADTGTVIRAPITKQDNNMHSAGGMYWSISDAGRWLRMNMNAGKLDGKQVIPAEIIQSVHTGYTQTIRDQPPFTGNGEYGLGWQIGKYVNEKVIYHHGGYTGWASHVSYMPDRNLGVAVMINESTAGGNVGHMLATYAYDLWLGTEGREATYAKQLDDGATNYGKAKEARQASVRSRASRTSQLTKPLQEYVGSYTNEQIGNIRITVDQNTLRVKLGNLEVLSTPFTEKETIRVELMPGEGEIIKFNMNPAGQIDSLNYAGLTFTRGAR